MGGGNGVVTSNVFQKDLLFTNIETMGNLLVQKVDIRIRGEIKLTNTVMQEVNRQIKFTVLGILFPRSAGVQN